MAESPIVQRDRTISGPRRTGSAASRSGTRGLVRASRRKMKTSRQIANSVMFYHLNLLVQTKECTQTSKERRRALRNIQGPRSRASLAAPPSHASLQSNHMGLGGTYSSALEDWLMTRQKTAHSLTAGSSGHYPLMLSDSVPDLTGTGNGNGFVNENSGISTNHSTPQRVPIHHQNKQHHQMLNNNTSRYSANAAVGYPLRQNSSYSSGFCGTPLRQHQIYQQQQQQQHKQFVNKLLDNDDDEFDGDFVDGAEVQLRRGNNINGGGQQQQQGQRRCDNDKDEWMYRRPLGPHDMRHSRKKLKSTILTI